MSLLSPQQVIEHVKNGTPREGWRIFRYSISNAILRILFWLFIGGVIFGMGYPLFVYGVEEDSKTLGIFVLIFGSLFLFAAFWNIYVTLFAKGSMIVLTEHGVVKSFSGKIEGFPYTSIEHLQLITTSGKNSYYNYRIEFVDSHSSQRILLAEKKVFGRADVIFDHLNSKLRSNS